MALSYRAMVPSSYARSVRSALRAAASCGAFAVAESLAACAGQTPPMPPTAIVAATRPANFATPRPSTSQDAPAIVAARFSSLDVALGDAWRGEIVTTTGTRAVALRTNLFDVGATRVSPGRFVFDVKVYDLPAFLVRPYALHVVARAVDGREATLVVPFRIGGRVASRR